MSDKKQTFIDPKTGEEIESTIFANLFFRLLVTALGLFSMFFGYNFTLGLLAFLCGLIALLSIISKQDNARINFVERAIHDAIARTQHFRRQRLFQRKLAEEEWAGVPARALTRVDPSTPPQATDVSLSQAENPEEEKPRLIVGAVEEESTDAKEEQSATI